MRECATTLAAEMSPEEHAFLLGLLRAERRPGSHLEIGTAAGGTLWQMMACFDESSRPQFVVVDPMRYFPNQFETVQRNIRDHGMDPDRVDFRRTTSSEAFKTAESRRERFDFMLIDGIHKIMPVTADLRWTRLLNVGGIVCFHDYCDAFPGVRLPVNRFLSGYRNFQKIGTGGSILALRKTAESRRPEIGLADWLYASAWHVPLQILKKINRMKERRMPQHQV